MSEAPIVVQQNHGAGNGSTNTLSIGPFTYTKGNRLVAAGIVKDASGGMAVSSIAGGEDTGYSWGLLSDGTHSGKITTGFSGTESVELWELASNAGGSITVTITFTPSTGLTATAQGFWIGELSGTRGIQPGTGVLTNSGSSVTPAGPSLTPKEAGALYLCVCPMSAAPSASPAAPWTVIAGPQTFSTSINPLAYQVTRALTALQPTWTQTTGSWASVGGIWLPARPRLDTVSFAAVQRAAVR